VGIPTTGDFQFDDYFVNRRMFLNIGGERCIEIVDISKA
ncbi:hypothetical protein PSYPI_45703, partial [Pseudomonas syringae pv. pisi str. 1704B]